MTKPESKRTTRVGACPLDCPDGCSWIVELEDDKPVRLTGNADHPFTGRALCAKTMPYLDEVARSDRLLFPQKRIGRKGDGLFERISWQEAFATIADNLHATIDEYGGEAIWPYAGSGTVGWIQGIVGSGKRLFHYLNASQHNPNICSAAGHVGMSYTTGSAMGMNPEDLVHSKLIILWATNTIETNQHLWPFIQNAQRELGAQLVVVDPIRTASAKRADLHVPIQPGTDGALVLGLMHELQQIGAIDHEYLDQRSTGWDEFFSNQIAGFDKHAAATICGIPASTIELFAQLIADSAPTVGIKTAMGLQQHHGGGQAARLLSCLPAVLGSFEVAGGGICYSTGPAYVLNHEALCRPDLQQIPSRTLAMTRLGTNLLDLSDPPVKSLFIWAGNPVVSNPQQDRVRRGLSREDLFTVVVDNFQTDTADYADLLLPGTMQTEHADLHDSYSHLYLQWNEPLVDPRGECLSHTEIFRQIARAMELDEPALFATDEQLARDTLCSSHPAMAGITLEGLKERGLARLNYPSPYLPFLESFPTASGKFEFTSELAELRGHGRLPHYLPPRESARSAEGNDGSFALISSANMRTLNSVYGNRERHSNAAVVTLHSDDLQQLNLEPGAQVRVWNERGEFTAQVQSSPNVRTGTAHTVKGLWPKANGGSNVNATVAEVEADMGQGAVFKDNRVWIEGMATS